MRFENVYVGNIRNAMRGMRNPMSGWERSDTTELSVGPQDKILANKLVHGGPPHRKFLRQVFVSVDIVKAPAYWMHEFATYKVGTTLDCSSTMHKITSRPLAADDFEEPETGIERSILGDLIQAVNVCRDAYLDAKGGGDTGRAERFFRSMKRLLPHSYLYERMTWTANYEVLRNIWQWRHNHRLPAWHEFCRDFIEQLPCSTWLTAKECYDG